MALTPEVRRKLLALRKVTRDFDAAHGYNLNKDLSKKRIATIERYWTKFMELTNKPHIEFAPPKGWKREAYKYATQESYPRFNLAYIPKVDEAAPLEFSLSKNRPRGSRFTVTDTRNGQRYYHIPSTVFLNKDHKPDLAFVRWLTEVQGEDVSLLKDELFYQYAIEYYSGDAEFYLIKAGESYMWGSGGGAPNVAKKIDLILNNYGQYLFDGSPGFDPNDKNSHHYNNWFRGVTAFTDRYTVLPLIGEAKRKFRKRRAELHIKTPENTTYRILSDGSIGIFVDGRYTGERNYPKSNGPRK